MRIAIYSRKSVATGRGESIENQFALCRALAENRFPGAEIRLFEDEGFSGRSLDRPQLRTLLACQQAEPFHAVVCYRLDRISRSVSDFSALLERFHAQGTAFLSVREQFDTSSPMGRAMLYIASVFAQLERETIAERVRDNMRGLARSGRWLGGKPPLGYRAVPSTDGKPCVYLAEDPETLPAVRQAFLAAAAGHSAAECADILAGHGCPLSSAAVRGLLENPVYCAADDTAIQYFSDAVFCFDGCAPSRGLAPYGRRAAGQPLLLALGQHPPAVTGTEWAAAQRPHRAYTPHSETGLLAGFAVCARCGRPLTVKRRSNSSARFDYLCAGRRGGSGCDCPALTGLQADAAARQAVLDCGAENVLITSQKRKTAAFPDDSYRWAGDLAQVFDRLSRGEQRKWVQSALARAAWDGETLVLEYARKK